MKPKLVLTGGGTAGHVTPNIALIPELLKKGWEIHYLGTKKGVESSILPLDKIFFHQIRAGKLRRYFSFKNFIDPLNVIYGIVQSYFILNKIKPTLIFSKGGYVSVPVIIGGWLNGIPSIIHESDVTPGLANKISLPFCNIICTTFSQTSQYIKSKKLLHTGLPLRDELFNGDVQTGMKLCGFDFGKPILLVIGGTQGSASINELVRSSLKELLEEFQIVHICGKSKVDNELLELMGYKQFEYVKDELPHLFKIADIAISRAGSNAIFEFINLGIQMVLFPLPKRSSRGEQLSNALTLEKMGICKTLIEGETTKDVLINELKLIINRREVIIEKVLSEMVLNGKEKVLNLINSYYIKNNNI